MVIGRVQSRKSNSLALGRRAIASVVERRLAPESVASQDVSERKLKFEMSDWIRRRGMVSISATAQAHSPPIYLKYPSTAVRSYGRLEERDRPARVPLFRRWKSIEWLRYPARYPASQVQATPTFHNTLATYNTCW